MKLGSRCLCPLTGVRGYVVTFRHGVPIARTDDGTLFKANVRGGLKRGPKKQLYVRVLDEGETLTHWMKAKLLDNGNYLLHDHPVFGGAEVEAGTLEIMEDDE